MQMAMIANDPLLLEKLYLSRIKITTIMLINHIERPSLYSS